MEADARANLHICGSPAGYTGSRVFSQAPGLSCPVAA